MKLVSRSLYHSSHYTLKSLLLKLTNLSACYKNCFVCDQAAREDATPQQNEAMLSWHLQRYLTRHSFPFLLPPRPLLHIYLSISATTINLCR